MRRIHTLGAVLLSLVLLVSAGTAMGMVSDGPDTASLDEGANDVTIEQHSDDDDGSASSPSDEDSSDEDDADEADDEAGHDRAKNGTYDNRSEVDLAVGNVIIQDLNVSENGSVLINTGFIGALPEDNATERNVTIISPGPADMEGESFEVDDLDAPEEATVNDTVEISANVTNTNEFETAQMIEFRLDGDVEQRQVVELDANESTTVTFELDTTGLEAGTYIHGVQSTDFGEVATIELTEEEELEEVEAEEEPEEEPDDEPEETVPEASVNISDQESDGTSVVVDEVNMSEGGFVAIHDETLLEGEVTGSVIGVSEYLEPGEHEDVEVTLFTDVAGADFNDNATLENNSTVISMPHLDTNSNEVYDFVFSDGTNDGPYVDDDGQPVTDDAMITVEEEDEEVAEDEEDEEDVEENETTVGEDVEENETTVGEEDEETVGEDEEDVEENETTVGEEDEETVGEDEEDVEENETTVGEEDEETVGEEEGEEENETTAGEEENETTAGEEEDEETVGEEEGVEENETAAGEEEDVEGNETAAGEEEDVEGNETTAGEEENGEEDEEVDDVIGVPGEPANESDDEENIGEDVEEDGENGDEVENVSEASVNVTDQESNGTTVVVDEVNVSEGGFVTIHNESLEDGDALEDGDTFEDGDALEDGATNETNETNESIIGVSEYLEPGEHEDVEVELYTNVTGVEFDDNATLENNSTVTAIPHLDTNGNETYDFVATNGTEDGHYVDDDGEPVTDNATVTLETAAETSVNVSNQDSNGTTVVVDEVELEEGGFVTIHDDSLLEAQIFESVIGVSEYLEPGEHEDVEIELFTNVSGTDFDENASLDDGDLAIAMPHFDTNGNETYDFVETNGAEDGPYVDEDSQPITGEAIVSVEAGADAGVDTGDNSDDEDQ